MANGARGNDGEVTSLAGSPWARVRAAAAGVLPAIVACALAGLLDANAPDLYYRVVQEDEALEWATFWCFALAGFAFLRAAFAGLRGTASAGWIERWFPAGLGAFCLVVALEEISWGQRLIGFRAPTYFLQHNFQQELNLHNVISSDWRQAGFVAIALGYGVALPIAAAFEWMHAALERMGIAAPAPELAPAFAAAGLVFAAYPWKFTGEWTEFLLGAAFLGAAVAQRAAFRVDSQGMGRARPASRWALGLLVALCAGLLSAEGSALVQRDSPESMQLARAEVAALQRDFQAARTRTHCGLHKRVYTYVEEHGAGALRSGAYVSRVGSGLPEERARFFIDPWNSPYWIRHMCNSSRTQRSVFVYSFGPNRKRDSDRWSVVPDDVGAYVKGGPRAAEDAARDRD